MRDTKIMLAIVGTLLATWTFISLIGFLLSDTSLRECYTHGGTLMLMLMLGWLPSVVVANDLIKKLNK
jgi:hypothetical protein